jgi:hypothetical protein
VVKTVLRRSLPFSFFVYRHFMWLRAYGRIPTRGTEMNYNEVLSALNQRLAQELNQLAIDVRKTFLIGTANSDQLIAYQIILPNDNDVRFNVVVVSDAPKQTAKFLPPGWDTGLLTDAAKLPVINAATVAAKLTTYITLEGRRGQAQWMQGYNFGDSKNTALRTEGNATLDNLIPWIWLADTEQQRIYTALDFTAMNEVAIVKKTGGEIVQGAEYTLSLSGTTFIQLALTPTVGNTAEWENHWTSDNPAIASVTDWVEGGALGGLVTAVAIGEVIVRNSVGKQIVIKVTA